MRSGVLLTVTERRLVRVQAGGQVTLPAAVRKRLRLKTGDLLLVLETPEGILLAPRAVVAAKALDRIGQVLREQGLSLDELIESGREARGRLIEEQYGIRSDDEHP